MKPEFMEWPKIARLSRGMVVTEKLDGTNAQILITDEGEMHVGSRNRWITPEDDNYGFARWVENNKEELMKLGPGRHFGEWWGLGIQRNYGIKEKRFSLFNTSRWIEGCPAACCSVVPVLFTGDFDISTVNAVIGALKEAGSRSAPGFMNPEGVVIYHAASRTLFKKTLEKDEEPKGKGAP